MGSPALPVSLPLIGYGVTGLRGSMQLLYIRFCLTILCVNETKASRGYDRLRNPVTP
jgi:hypothetical protein